MEIYRDWRNRIEEVYARQADTVWRVCYSYMQNPHDTDDMVQETFLRLIGADPQFSDEKKERAWLIVTASNLCKDVLKSRERRHVPLEEQKHLAVEGPAPNALASAIQGLKDSYKMVVYLHYYEGYDMKEIAGLLNISEGNVKMTLHRARRRLRGLLEEKP